MSRTRRRLVIARDRRSPVQMFSAVCVFKVCPYCPRFLRVVTVPRVSDTR